MRAWFAGLSKGIRLVVVGGGVVLIALVAVAVAMVSRGESTISDSTSCEEFVQSEPGARDDYLASKLESITGDALSSGEVGAYLEGVGLNCSKGYGESTSESVERTSNEVNEVRSEGGDLYEGIALIRERAGEREAFGEVQEELELAEELE